MDSTHRITIGSLWCRVVGAWLLPVVVAVVVAVAGASPAAAQTGFTPSTDPLPEIPPGAHLEGDILKWDISIQAPPRGTYWAAPAGNYWSSGVVPYVFASNVTAANQTAMLAAMAQWENVANVNFRPWQTGDSNWLLIQNSTANNSFVGPQGGAQVVNIFNWNFQFIMAHELGHALGVEHEQSRSDRDTYVTINTGNISSICGADGASSCSYNFNIGSSTSGWLYSPYDYDSVMHYGAASFTTGGNTIDTNTPFDGQDIPFTGRPIGPNGQCFTDPVPAGGWQNGIGQRTHLSHWDCRTMSFLYPQADWRFVSASRANIVFQFGSFTLPWDTVTQALSGTPAGGTVWVDTGIYDAVGTTTINQAITILAPKGRVILR